MEDPQFVKRFRDAERPGVYCRVLQPGSVTAGDPVETSPYEGDGERVTILEMFRAAFTKKPDEATLRRFLNAPIDVRSRRTWERLVSG